MKGESVKNGNYILIQSFMVNDLELKGNELLVYAIIYGFSQAKDNRFTGSLQYLADWTRSTKQGVIKNLKSLMDKGFIVKEERITNGVKFVEYYVTEFNGVLNSVEQGYSTEFNGGIKLSLPNNIDNNLTDNKGNNIYRRKPKKKAEFVPPTVEEVREYAKAKNALVDPDYFHEHYTLSEWTDKGGNPIQNWKQVFLNWERREQKNGNAKPVSSNSTESAEEKRRRYNIHYDNE